jgi:hypothetical protein
MGYVYRGVPFNESFPDNPRNQGNFLCKYIYINQSSKFIILFSIFF